MSVLSEVSGEVAYRFVRIDQDGKRRNCGDDPQGQHKREGVVAVCVAVIGAEEWVEIGETERGAKEAEEERISDQEVLEVVEQLIPQAACYGGLWWSHVAWLCWSSKAA